MKGFERVDRYPMMPPIKVSFFSVMAASGGSGVTTRWSWPISGAWLGGGGVTTTSAPSGVAPMTPFPAPLSNEFPSQWAVSHFISHCEMIRLVIYSIALLCFFFFFICKSPMFNQSQNVPLNNTVLLFNLFTFSLLVFRLRSVPPSSKSFPFPPIPAPPIRGRSG